MISNEKEAYYRKVMWKNIRQMTKAYLDSKEMAQKYLTRNDKKEIDEKVNELALKATDTFILKLKEGGYLEDKEPTQEEFGKLLKKSIEECFGDKDADNTR